MRLVKREGARIWRWRARAADQRWGLPILANMDRLGHLPPWGSNKKQAGCLLCKRGLRPLHAEGTHPATFAQLQFAKSGSSPSPVLTDGLPFSCALLPSLNLLFLFSCRPWILTPLPNLPPREPRLLLPPRPPTATLAGSQTPPAASSSTGSARIGDPSCRGRRG